MPQKVTSLRVDEELWKRAKIYSIQKGVTLSELVESLIRKELGEEQGVGD